MVVRRRSAGFSMLEATIALAVIATVAAAFVSAGPRQIRATGAAFRAAAAQRLAESALEEARHTEPVAGETVLDAMDGTTPAGATVVRSAREHEPGLWEIEAVVSWDEPGEPQPRTVRLVTLLAREAPR